MKGMYANEAYSTKMCSKCHRVTGDVKYWKEVEKVDGSKKVIKVKIYGLRRCTNNECRITWDRDHNARINIFVVMEYLIDKKDRPIYLTKQKKITIFKKKLQETTEPCSLPVQTHGSIG